VCKFTYFFKRLVAGLDVEGACAEWLSKPTTNKVDSHLT
jgi:hypothetical protein